MIEYRRAQLRDAEAIAALHARSWRESYRGAFTDAFLDGDLPGERASKRRGIESSLLRQAGSWLGLHHSALGIHLWVLEGNTAARRFYEHLGAHDAGSTTMETHGGAIVRSCRYVWPNPQALSAARRR